MRILVIEDDAVLCDVVVRSLSDAGHHVDQAVTLDEAAHWWQVQSYDAILLDLNLPCSAARGSAMGNGLELLRTARRRGDSTPVLVLTARNQTHERIAGLDSGADDYLGKPFELAEVEARLRALVRRAIGTQDTSTVGQLSLERNNRRFRLGTQSLDLPAREFAVLWELMSPPGRVVNKRSLSNKLSGLDEAVGDNALEAFISRLRKKLQHSGAAIRTLRGVGYLVEADGDHPP